MKISASVFVLAGATMVAACGGGRPSGRGPGSYPDGDGFLAYPGKPAGIDGPASTIRLEQIRQGLEDYEALTMLADLAARAKQSGRASPEAEQALAMARDLVRIPNAGGLRSTEILPDPARVPAVRKAVNAGLVRLISQRGAAPHRALAPRVARKPRIVRDRCAEKAYNTAP